MPLSNVTLVTELLEAAEMLLASSSDVYYITLQMDYFYMYSYNTTAVHWNGSATPHCGTAPAICCNP
jgi:hypothetical protein